ncbi:MAG: RNA-binding transcriptional accessory protein [Candidatus Obscuribacterales bacterium]|nr:RNA-binding transcriptional accessory protein [Candidatus Obscuribacterales bacterium]
MKMDHIEKISSELKISASSVKATIDLFSDGCTIPFIARYRKESTGTLDEVAIGAIRDRLAQLQELDKRREAILESLTERNLLTDELSKKVTQAATLTDLEDVYLPYRPKRKTRASAAREKGLEPLARKLFHYESKDPHSDAAAFINAEKGVESAEDALSGARDIVAEWISEDETCRKEMRKLWAKRSTISSLLVKGKEEAGAKFKDYFDWSESAAAAPSHRILAMLRGETEGFLRIKMGPPEEEGVRELESRYVRGSSPVANQLKLAVADCYKRLLGSSMETELRTDLKQRADIEAIKVFVNNLRELLMAPPLGQKAVLAVDPGFRTGCKVVCLDRQGKLLQFDVIYPHSDKAKSGEKIIALCKKFEVEAIALGNGTASRETDEFLRGIDFAKAGLSAIPVVMVNESGASIYSASEVAREEFPDQDLTVRGAVSIGRRLMDPLAELVKIDPKSIGVGQYQHDVDQNQLQKSLDDSVMSCVNSVGVELNTASKQLLSYVSGLSSTLASNIVKYRNENGAFASRDQLKKVPRLGPKAFEQCAGFLRIRDAGNPLDASAVHPERYGLVQKMAKDSGVTVEDLIRNESFRKRIDLRKYTGDGVGLPTLEDILAELDKPGRDPRAKLEPVKFADGVHTMDDLHEGMRLPGIITNVTAFGAFVDIGVHQDGLVHKSEMANRFVSDPSEVVKVNQKVEVLVLEVDKSRKRISLSMKR